MTKDVIEEMWNELKKECCVNPDTAVRCVMVSEDAFFKAMSRVRTPGTVLRSDFEAAMQRSKSAMEARQSL